MIYSEVLNRFKNKIELKNISKKLLKKLGPGKFKMIFLFPKNKV